MFTVAVFGSGKIGETICAFLASSGRYQLRMCDVNPEAAKKAASRWPGKAEAHTLNLADEAATLKILAGCQAVISALPFHCNPTVAQLACQAKVHYLDLTEDVSVTKQVMDLAKNAPVALMPQCGLAPGFISLAATHLIGLFDSVSHAKLRVGALPIFPSNRLKYNLSWSTEGLINEYGNLCEVIYQGQRQMVLPLEGLETFFLDGEEYEAFNTSGGLGTLCDTYAGKLQNLDYKSIRYRGHRDLMHMLMFELGFNEDRGGLKKVFERSIPYTAQDKVVIRAEVEGMVNGRLSQKTYASTVYNGMVAGQHFGAIQITTSAGICAPLDLLLTGELGTRKGFLKMEELSLQQLLDNEFGKCYRDERALNGIA